MDAQELRNLQEAYMEVVENQQQLDEALTSEHYKKVMKKPGGTAYSRIVSKDPSKRATRGGRGGESDFGAGDRGAGNRAARRAGTYQEEVSVYDIILSHLLDEGYAETPESAEAIMVNMSEEWREDIVEVSLKTASSAYDERKHREMTAPSNPKNVTKSGRDKSDETFRRVRKKYGQRVAKKMRDQNPYNKYDY